MKEDSTLFSVSPNVYAEHLERLTDAEFWNYAYEKAHMPRSMHAKHALTTMVTPPDDTLTCITCELRTAQCVLPLTHIREILSPSQHITLLPDAPPWMLGILSWRSETIAAIDLCSYLTKSNSSPLHNRVFLVVQHNHTSLAFCVLSIGSTTTIDNTQQVTPFSLPPVTEGSNSPPLGVVGMWNHGGTEQGQIFVLDMPAIFEDVVQCIEERKQSHE